MAEKSPLPVYKKIKLEVRDGVLIAFLNRPEKLNAFDEELRDEFINLLKYVAENQDEFSALVITGSGRAFSSGSDVYVWASYIEKGEDLDWSWTAEVVETFLKINIPVIIGLNGLAVGLGFNLLLWADYVIASRNVDILCPPFLRWGIPTGLGSTVLAPLMLGLKRAKQMYISGEKLDLNKALEMGLVDSIVEPEKLLDECLSIAKRLSSRGSLQAIREIKRLMMKAVSNSVIEAVRAEVESLNRLSKSSYFKERVKEFIEAKQRK